MPKIGIDLWALAVVAFTYVIAQVQSLSLKVRYGLMGSALGFYGLLRLTRRGSTINMVIAGIVVVLAIRYLILAFRSPR